MSSGKWGLSEKCVTEFFCGRAAGGGQRINCLLKNKFLVQKRSAETLFFYENIMKKTLLVLLSCFFFHISEAAASEEVYENYRRDVMPDILQLVTVRDFSNATIELKQMLLNPDLSQKEKISLLEKCFLHAKFLGYFKEAGEIFELSYTVADIDPELLGQIHASLTAYYKSVRSWEKCNAAHFYYLEKVPVSEQTKIAVLFDLAENYQNMRQYEKAEHVLSEILNICKEKKDFALVYYYRAQACFARNEYEESMELYKKALSYGEIPEEAKTQSMYNLALASEISKDYAQAKKYYEEVLPFYGNKMAIRKRLGHLKKTAPQLFGKENGN